MNFIKDLFNRMINWAKGIYDFFGFDGFLHIVISFILVKLFGYIGLPLYLAIIFTAIIGLAKEFIYDKYLGKGSCSKKDLIADLIGIIAACI